MGAALDGLRTELAARLDQMRETGVFKPERVMASPQGTHVVDTAGRDVLNLCANNYLGLADDPRVVASAEPAVAAVGVRHGVRALHLRDADHPPGAGAAARRVPRHRGRGPVRVLLRRERRGVRGPARRAGRGHLRRAEPRLDHRRRTAVQGAAAALRQPRHGRAGAAAGRGCRCALPARRHRRRVLDGRLPRTARRDLRARRPARRAGHGRRLARGRVRGTRRARHAGAVRGRRPRRHRDRHAGQGARRSVRRVRRGAPGDRRRCSSSGPVRTCSRTRSHRRSWRRR